MIATMLALMLAGSDQSFVGELRKRLESPITETIDSAKRPYDLEICITNAVVSIGTPIVLRDGPENTVVAASLSPTAQVFPIAVSLIQTPTGTRIEVRLNGKGWNDRMRDRMTACATSPNRF